jgi:hypothetical protein
MLKVVEWIRIVVDARNVRHVVVHLLYNFRRQNDRVWVLLLGRSLGVELWQRDNLLDFVNHGLPGFSKLDFALHTCGTKLRDSTCPSAGHDLLQETKQYVNIPLNETLLLSSSDRTGFRVRLSLDWQIAVEFHLIGLVRSTMSASCLAIGGRIAALFSWRQPVRLHFTFPLRDDFLISQADPGRFTRRHEKLGSVIRDLNPTRLSGALHTRSRVHGVYGGELR